MYGRQGRGLRDAYICTCKFAGAKGLNRKNRSMYVHCTVYDFVMHLKLDLAVTIEKAVTA